jgi:hypothetical protein
MYFSKTPPATSLPLRRGFWTGRYRVYLDLARARPFCSRLIVRRVHPELLNYVNALAPCRRCPCFHGETPMNWLDGSVLPENAATLQVLNI